jgi:hypothetical protein
MAFLMKQNRHPMAAKIFEAVNRVDPRCSRATTYNNLRDLVQAGLVREVAVEDRAAHLMRKACGITTSSATAAAMLRTWSGKLCPSVRGTWLVPSGHAGLQRTTGREGMKPPARHGKALA